ncbi:MAG: hypothetical protein ACYC9M_07345 [Desulfobulbaceae bacterium]
MYCDAGYIHSGKYKSARQQNVGFNSQAVASPPVSISIVVANPGPVRTEMDFDFRGKGGIWIEEVGNLDEGPCFLTCSQGLEPNKCPDAAFIFFWVDNPL